MDDHGPLTGCSFTKCGLGKPEHCPFVRDAKPRVFEPYEGAPEHEHQHVVPVEWEDGFISPASGEFVSAKHGAWGLHVVTRLRCACGDEIDRKPTTT